MKIIFAALCLVLWIPSAYASKRPYDWKCPLDETRPKSDPNQMFYIYMAPLEFMIENPDKSCKAWVERVTKARKLLLDFNEKTLTNLQTSAEELRKIGPEISDFLITMIMDAEKVLKDGKLCSGKTLDESMTTVFVQLVRSLYAANDKVRNAAGVADGVLKLTETIPAAIKAIGKTIKNVREADEAKYKKDACDFLWAEYERRCPRLHAETGMGQKKPALRNPSKEETALATKAWPGLESREISHMTLINGRFGEKSTFQHLLTPLRLTKPHSEVDWDSDWAVTNIYYEYIWPVLKMCGVHYGLQNYERPSRPIRDAYNGVPKYEEVCKPFFCKDQSLFPDPASPSGPDHGDNAFCEYAGGFPNMSEKYLKGFVQAARTRRDEFSFCPLEEAPPVVRRLPPVDGGGEVVPLLPRDEEIPH